MTKNFEDARKMLLNVCNGYIQHNQRQIDGLKAKSPYSPAGYIFFETVLDKYEPDPGFKDWICCQYHYLLDHLLLSFNETVDPYNYYSQHTYPFAEMKWWKEPETRYQEKGVDHTAPKTVLHNLNALFNVLNFHMEEKFPQLAQKKIELNYQENDPTTFSDAPLSIQIYKMFENLKLRARFAESIMEKRKLGIDISDFSRNLEDIAPVFEGYIKGIAVRESKATLDNQDLGDEEAVKSVEEQLKNGVTLELLKKNRQSQQERDLKFWSIILIGIGIGVFTTLGLVCKRFYDSGGTSINFFKPLSQNLYETIESITTGFEDEPKCKLN